MDQILYFLFEELVLNGEYEYIFFKINVMLMEEVLVIICELFIFYVDDWNFFIVMWIRMQRLVKESLKEYGDFYE